MAGASNGRDLRGFRALEALRHRDFRLLWTSQTVSLIGAGAFLKALLFLVRCVGPGFVPSTS